MFQASAYLDHKLKWDLFRLPELECFDTMLNKLFRDELIELVKRQEKIWRELRLIIKLLHI